MAAGLPEAPVGPVVPEPAGEHRVNQPPLSEAEAARFLPTAEDPFPAPRESLDLADAELSFNRELSWVDFNDRVLQLAEDPAQPLLERVKFAAIFTSNLDEFFMIRVAGLHDQVEAGITEKRRDGPHPVARRSTRCARASSRRCERQARCVDESCGPALAEHGIRDRPPRRGAARTSAPALGERFQRQIFPVLTPLAVGLGRPFPYISNLSLSLAVLVRDPRDRPDGVRAREGARRRCSRASSRSARAATTFVPLEDLIADNLDALFPGMEILDHGVFRVTRDADFEISDEADDLLRGGRGRAAPAPLRRGRAARGRRTGISAALREQLVEALARRGARRSTTIAGLLDLNDLWQIVGLPGHRELRDEPWTPVTAPRAAVAEADEHDMFAVIRAGRPARPPPVRLVRDVGRALRRRRPSRTPTCSRSSRPCTARRDDSPLVPALIRATERGKQAVCLVELKARFDEQREHPVGARRWRRRACTSSTACPG